MKVISNSCHNWKKYLSQGSHSLKFLKKYGSLLAIFLGLEIMNKHMERTMSGKQIWKKVWSFSIETSAYMY